MEMNLTGSKLDAAKEKLKVLTGAAIPEEGSDKVMTEPVKRGTVVRPEVTVPSVDGVRPEVIQKAVAAAIADGRYAAWSRPVKAVLVSLKKTVPEFSESKFVSEYLEKHLAQDYPDLYARITSELSAHES